MPGSNHLPGPRGAARRWLPAPALVLALLLALLSGEGCSRPAPAAPAAPAVSFEVKVTGDQDVEFAPDNPQVEAIRLAPARAVVQVGEEFSGHLVWDEERTTPIYSPVSGRVEKITADIGQQVAAGEDLALMHSPDFGQAQADLNKAQSDLIQAEKVLARTRRLLDFGSAAQKDLESAQADFNRASAEKQRADLFLRKLSDRVGGEFSDLYHVRSPLAGTVVDKKINVGQEVRPDIVLAGVTSLATSPLFRVSDPTRLWAQLDVPEVQLGRLRVGLPVVVRTPAYPDRPFHGRLVVVGASLDPVTRVGQARAAVENPERLLKAEMYVRVGLELSPADPPAPGSVVRVPSAAVFYLERRFYLFVQTGPRKFSRREVNLVHEDPDGTVVVRGGVEAGQAVVTEGNLLLNGFFAGAGPGPSFRPSVRAARTAAAAS